MEILKMTVGVDFEEDGGGGDFEDDGGEEILRIRSASQWLWIPCWHSL